MWEDFDRSGEQHEALGITETGGICSKSAVKPKSGASQKECKTYCKKTGKRVGLCLF